MKALARRLYIVWAIHIVTGKIYAVVTYEIRLLQNYFKMIFISHVTTALTSVLPHFRRLLLTT